MRVLVFATEETPDGPGVSPFVVIPDSAGAYLPQHPFGREWRYFAPCPLAMRCCAPSTPASRPDSRMTAITSPIVP